MIIDFIRESLNVLLDLCADSLILPSRIPRRVWVVSQGINCQFSEGFRVLDIFEQVLTLVSIVLPAIAKQLFPA